MHVSRHFLGAQPTVVRSIPFAPAGPPEQDGVSLQNRLLALADFSQDGEVTMGPQTFTRPLQYPQISQVH